MKFPIFGGEVKKSPLTGKKVKYFLLLVKWNTLRRYFNFFVHNINRGGRNEATRILHQRYTH